MCEKKAFIPEMHIQLFLHHSCHHNRHHRHHLHPHPHKHHDHNDHHHHFILYSFTHTSMIILTMKGTPKVLIYDIQYHLALSFV